ncbi:hypothetical protein I3842_09G142100 [Carya illinoinensis]|uniref:Uncharacterized protein n=1 Tax=Carya illinoinensis TaxID=32201 RepID=A0A922J7U7_CARIL|nr:hypothetical protein I3842_09G142100 [Carya illinoinensis]
MLKLLPIFGEPLYIPKSDFGSWPIVGPLSSSLSTVGCPPPYCPSLVTQPPSTTASPSAIFAY